MAQGEEKQSVAWVCLYISDTGHTSSNLLPMLKLYQLAQVF
jgi:hypothetical protein